MLYQLWLPLGFPDDSFVWELLMEQQKRLAFFQFYAKAPNLNLERCSERDGL